MRKLIVIFLFFGGALLAVLLNPAWAGSYQVLYSFCKQANCPDGYQPNNIMMDKAGVLYGTTSDGGGVGHAFSLAYNNGTWSETTLYTFCSKLGCLDGIGSSGVIEDTNGNLYGVTGAGGKYAGTAYELMPNAKKTKWSIHILFQFCKNDVGTCNPYGDLSYAGQEAGNLYDGKSPLYGIADSTTSNGDGLVYELLPGSPWKEKVLYTFCSQQNCADGDNPQGQPLRIDSAGNIYGTTEGGGAYDIAGTVFRLSPNTKRTKWTETLLYNFCSLSKCKDGKTPRGVFLDTSGNLFGATAQGGRQTNTCEYVYNISGCGVVYELAQSGGKWTESVLYDFCSQKKCDDGTYVYTPLIMDSSGNLFGPTLQGGANTDGVIFELSGPTYNVLHTFCSLKNCADGSFPYSAAGLVVDNAGNVYGTTEVGGAYSSNCPTTEQCGTVFEWSP